MQDFSIKPLDASAPYCRNLFGGLGVYGINCGSGNILREGCLNVDRIQLRDHAGNVSRPGTVNCIQTGDRKIYYLEHDLTQALPMQDGALDWGFSEHFVEHMSQQQTITWLTEMRRVIRLGGLLRITTPDLEKYVKGYLEPNGAFFKAHR